MCGRYVIFTSEEYKEMAAILKEIEKHYKTGFGVLRTGEVFPSHMVPAVRMSRSSPVYSLMQWGIPLHQSRRLINARGETLAEKPVFSRLLPGGRCLLPANGFYEWKEKVKYLIQPEEMDTFYFAGLSDRDDRFVIITADASEQMRPIHDRMPVILNKTAGRAWLEKTDTSLLVPYPGILSIKKAG
ncbi:MAG: SOS response-associated peptidase [Clostridia bacterium]